MTYETYQAKANAQIASELANMTSLFTTKLRFPGELRQAPLSTLKDAAESGGRQSWKQ